MLNPSYYSPDASSLQQMFVNSPEASFLKNPRIIGLAELPSMPKRLDSFVPTNFFANDWESLPSLSANVIVTYGMIFAGHNYFRSHPSTTGLSSDLDSLPLLYPTAPQGLRFAICGTTASSIPVPQNYLVIAADDFLTTSHPVLRNYKPLVPHLPSDPDFNPFVWDSVIGALGLFPGITEPLLNITPIAREVWPVTGSIPLTETTFTSTKPQLTVISTLTPVAPAVTSHVTKLPGTANRLAFATGYLRVDTVTAGATITIEGYTLSQVEGSDKIFNLVPYFMIDPNPAIGKIYKLPFVTRVTGTAAKPCNLTPCLHRVIFAVLAPGSLVFPATGGSIAYAYSDPNVKPY